MYESIEQSLKTKDDVVSVSIKGVTFIAEFSGILVSLKNGCVKIKPTGMINYDPLDEHGNKYPGDIDWPD